MPEALFRRKADTGDILLFSGKRLVCGIQRFITQSRFGTPLLAHSLDHVAMLLRYDNGKLYILESTNGDGVAVCEWNEQNMRDYQDCYGRIVFRHLRCKRTLESITKLQTFLNVRSLCDIAIESEGEEVQAHAVETAPVVLQHWFC